MSWRTPWARRSLAVVVVAVVALTGAACSKKDDTSEHAASPGDVMKVAQGKLDDTSGLQLSLTTQDLPEGVTGLVSAEGTGTDAPAFDGTITVVIAGTEVPVPVIAVGGKVFAKIPLTVGWSDVDPSEYGAPDPAALMAPGTGFSSLLPITTDLKKGDSERGGADNNEILTVYTGKVPGEAMRKVIPSSSGDSFDVAYEITDQGELREAKLTGVFYPKTDAMTYTVTFDAYGTTKEISAP
ncbi:MAG: LppX_LprAFG lipoprotein [Nocardioides sp.]|uniref:LppX_LprAFG lipoprotein n=1 Tax=Nocardioides sp. TaxID=35761 RepID=UPI0039E50E9F